MSTQLPEGGFIMKKQCKYDECTFCIGSLQHNPYPEIGHQCGVVYKTSCGHEFHTFCLWQWTDSWYSPVEKSGLPPCPVCRQGIEMHETNTLWALIHNRLMNSCKYKRAEFIVGVAEEKDTWNLFN